MAFYNETLIVSVIWCKFCSGERRVWRADLCLCWPHADCLLCAGDASAVPSHQQPMPGQRRRAEGCLHDAVWHRQGVADLAVGEGQPHPGGERVERQVAAPLHCWIVALQLARDSRGAPGNKSHVHIDTLCSWHQNWCSNFTVINYIVCQTLWFICYCIRL